MMQASAAVLLYCYKVLPGVVPGPSAELYVNQRVSPLGFAEIICCIVASSYNVKHKLTSISEQLSLETSKSCLHTFLGRGFN